MRRLVIAWLVAGCGRVAFDPYADDRTDAGGMSDAGASDLVAHYSCDGDPTSDGTGHHPGTCVGPCPTSTPGIVGSACHFSGASLISIASAPDLETDTLTVAAWVRRASNDQTQNIISKVMGTLSDNTWQLVSEGGELQYCLTSPSGSGLCNSGGAPAALPLDTWVHVALVEAASNYRVYAGDVELGNGSLELGYDSEPVLFGGDVDNQIPTNFLTGDLDEIRIYNRALSAAEIAVLATPP